MLKGKRGFNIDLPASQNAIMRRAVSLPRREQWTRQEQYGELDTYPGIREQNRHEAEGLAFRGECLLTGAKRTHFRPDEKV